ncbi:hypothetical protein [Caudoviricetes sp.]|nr:hypothetical protein [Caudoviricetes sp.]
MILFAIDFFLVICYKPFTFCYISLQYHVCFSLFVCNN